MNGNSTRRAPVRETEMRRIIQAIRKFLADESSPAAVEYAVMIALVGVVVIVGARSLGRETRGVLKAVADVVEELFEKD